VRNINLHLFLPGIILLLAFGCDKNNDLLESKVEESKNSYIAKGISSSDIIGVWVNTLNNQDTIKICDTLITRWYFLANSYGHFYKFFIKKDSIVLHYAGINKIGLPPYQRKIYLNNNKDSLIIQGFNSVHPSYPGDVFTKTSK